MKYEPRSLTFSSQSQADHSEYVTGSKYLIKMYAQVKRKLDLWKPKLVFEIPNQNL